MECGIPKSNIWQNTILIFLGKKQANFTKQKDVVKIEKCLNVSVKCKIIKYMFEVHFDLALCGIYVPQKFN